MIKSERRAVLVEDHPLTRTLLKTLLTSMGFHVAATNTVEHAIQLIEHLDPELLVTDLDLGGGPTGVQLALWAHDHRPELGVVLLTAHRSTQLIDSTPLPASPRRVHLVKDEIYASETLQQAVDAVLGASDAGVVEPQPGTFTLSRDQAEVLRMMAQGLSNAEIAKRRNSTVSAVENSARRIYAALGLAGDESINARSAAVNLFQKSAITVK